VPARPKPPHREREDNRLITSVPHTRVARPIDFPFSCEIEMRPAEDGPVSWVEGDRAQG